MRVVKNGDIHVSAPYGMPKSQVERFIDEHHDWMIRAREITEQRQRKRQVFYDQLPQQTKIQRLEAQQRLSAIIEPMVEQHAKEMGVIPKTITYKALKSRWGQCNVRPRSITFSTYLLLLPQWCIEHVVVHELCHLLEPSHNTRFHTLMDRYFPLWREARKATRSLP